MDIIIVVLLAVTAVVSVGAFFLLWSSRNKKSAESELMKMMLERMDLVKGDLSDRLRDIKEFTEKTGTTTTQAYGQLQHQLGKHSEALERVMEQTRDIKRLQDLLSPSKTRGIVGETLLENLLKDQLVEGEQFQRQHGFKSREVVDFVIVLPDLLVPIDAKFPIESYERLINVIPEERDAAEKAFSVSVKQKIDEIRKKYILPQEGTTDFALMYLPSEGMYATILNMPSLRDYITEYRVIPVSPSTLFAYLTTINMGFKGMKISQSANELRAALATFSNDINTMDERLKISGKHMREALKSEEDAEKQLSKIIDKFNKVILKKEESNNI